jgi:hypothetical protein
MNYNPLPVKMRALTLPSPEGRGKEGEEFETTWIHCKNLEREGAAERVIEFKERALEPIKDVLIFTPMYRLEVETVTALMGLDWEGALSLLIQRDNPSGDPKADHLHQYQRGREAFLMGRYEAMLVVESDIIPPADALKRLAALNADVAYGVYQFRNAELINVFELYPVPFPPQHTGDSLSCRPYLLQRALREGKFPCSGGGLGICLIRRSVLERIEFRNDQNEQFCDSAFTEDVLHGAFRQVAEMKVVCGHKDVDSEVQWPNLNHGDTENTKKFKGKP